MSMSMSDLAIWHQPRSIPGGQRVYEYRSEFTRCACRIIRKSTSQRLDKVARGAHCVFMSLFGKAKAYIPRPPKEGVMA